MRVPGGGQRVYIPPGRSQVVICFLRNTVIYNLEKKLDPLGSIASKREARSALPSVKKLK